MTELDGAQAGGPLAGAERILVVLFEAVTAIQCVLFSLSAAWDTWSNLLRGGHYVLATAAAVVVARGALRRKAWTPKAAVVVAAFLGLPNLAYLGNLVGGFASSGFTPAMLSYSLLSLLGVWQLVPFFVGLRRLAPAGARLPAGRDAGSLP